MEKQLCSLCLDFASYVYFAYTDAMVTTLLFHLLRELLGFPRESLKIPMWTGVPSLPLITALPRTVRGREGTSGVTV